MKYTKQKTRQMELLLIEHNSYKSTDELCSILNCSPRTIGNFRKKLNLRGKFFIKGSRIKHVEKHNIPDIKLGWCIGFFAADGSLNTNRKNRSPINRIMLSLSIKDQNTLFDFFNTLVHNIDYPLFKIKPPSIGKLNKVSYQITAPNFEKEIKNILLFKNKTYDININKENFIKKSLLFKVGFLRGVIDGDGYVSKKSYIISIVSASEQFIKDLQILFGGKIKKRKSGNYWDLIFNKKEILFLLEMGINENCDIFMQRKSLRLCRMRE